MPYYVNVAGVELYLCQVGYAVGSVSVSVSPG